MNEAQKDFFQELKKESVPLDPIRSMFRSRPNPFVSISLEQIFVILIVGIIGLILVFLLGVVRGKAIHREPASHETLPVEGTHPLPYPSKNIHPQPTAALPLDSTRSEIPMPIEDRLQKPYTIQVITYRSEERARKEADGLQAKKIEAYLFKRSGYYEVCVGRYENRKSAEKDLAALRSQYKDCFLRRI